MFRFQSLAVLLCASVLAISGCATSPSDELETEEETETEETGEASDELKACWGDASCNELFSSSACQGSAWCYESGSGSSYSVICVCS